MRRLLLVAALPLILSACEGGGDPVQQAIQEVSANNHARTVKDGQVSGVSAVATTEGSTDQTYIDRMIVLHESAAANARVTLEQAGDPQVRKWAQDVIDTSEREIIEMKAWKPAQTAVNNATP